MRKMTVWAAAFGTCLVSIGGYAQTYPTKPIRMVVPYAPGGTTEVLARLVAQKMGETLGQQMVIDTRPGASGTVGTNLVAKASPDGYTVLWTSLSPIVINVTTQRSLPYDPQKELAPISLITQVPSLFAVHPSVPVKSIQDLIALAKAHPGKLKYGSSGAGGINHLTAELFNAAAGIDILHVPYKGAGPAVIAAMGKEVDMAVAAPPAMMAQIAAGRLRPVAVTGASRSPALPDVPAVAEVIPGFTATAWYALFAPAGTPATIVQRLHSALVSALEAPAVKERLAGEGAVPETCSPKALAELIRSDIPRWAKALKVAGIKE